MHLAWVPMGLAALRCSDPSPWGMWAPAYDGGLRPESPSLETAHFERPQLAAGTGESFGTRRWYLSAREGDPV